METRNATTTTNERVYYLARYCRTDGEWEALTEAGALSSMRHNAKTYPTMAAAEAAADEREAVGIFPPVTHILTAWVTTEVVTVTTWTDDADMLPLGGGR